MATMVRLGRLEETRRGVTWTFSWWNDGEMIPVGHARCRLYKQTLFSALWSILRSPILLNGSLGVCTPFCFTRCLIMTYDITALALLLMYRGEVLEWSPGLFR